MTDREEFEAWLLVKYGHCSSYEMDKAFEIWQASRETKEQREAKFLGTGPCASDKIVPDLMRKKVSDW